MTSERETVQYVQYVQCVECGCEYPARRRRLGFVVCLTCGEARSRKIKHCIVPMHKSNLVVVSPTDKDLLVGITNKGGVVTASSSGSSSLSLPTGGVKYGRGEVQQKTIGKMGSSRDPVKSPNEAFIPRRRTYETGFDTTVPRYDRCSWDKIGSRRKI